MADYIAVLPSQVQPKAPGNSELFNQLAYNPVAIAEGSTDAPVVAGGWVPYDWDTYNQNTNGGLVYSHSVDGDTDTISLTGVEGNWEFMITVEGLSLSFPNANSQFSVYKNGAWYDFTSVDSSTISYEDMMFYLPLAGFPLTFCQEITSPMGGLVSTPAYKVDGFRLTVDSGVFDGGIVRLFKRGCHSGL